MGFLTNSKLKIFILIVVLVVFLVNTASREVKQGEVIWGHDFSNGMPSEFNHNQDYPNSGTWGRAHSFDGGGVYEPASIDGEELKMTGPDCSYRGVAYPTNIPSNIQEWQITYRVDARPGSTGHGDRITGEIAGIGGTPQGNYNDDMEELNYRAGFREYGDNFFIGIYNQYGQDYRYFRKSANVDAASGEWMMEIKSSKMYNKTWVKYWRPSDTEPSSYDHEFNLYLDGRPGLGVKGTCKGSSRYNYFDFYELKEIVNFNFESTNIGNTPSEWTHYQDKTSGGSYCSDCEVGYMKVVDSPDKAGKSLECREKSNGNRFCYISLNATSNTQASFDYRLYLDSRWSQAKIGIIGENTFDPDNADWKEVIDGLDTGDSMADVADPDPGWQSIENYDLSHYEGEDVYFALNARGRQEGNGYLSYVRIDDLYLGPKADQNNYQNPQISVNNIEEYREGGNSKIDVSYDVSTDSSADLDKCEIDASGSGSSKKYTSSSPTNPCSFSISETDKSAWSIGNSLNLELSASDSNGNTVSQSVNSLFVYPNLDLSYSGFLFDFDRPYDGIVLSEGGTDLFGFNVLGNYSKEYSVKAFSGSKINASFQDYSEGSKTELSSKQRFLMNLEGSNPGFTTLNLTLTDESTGVKKRQKFEVRVREYRSGSREVPGMTALQILIVSLMAFILKVGYVRR
jgi:hypothetical protein